MITRSQPRQWAIIMCLSIVLSSLCAGCASKAITQTNETARYRVTMTLDAPALGQRSIDLIVKDRNGADVDVEQIILAPVMHDMGMASPEMSAQKIAPGHYRVSGEPFSMTGIWHLDLRLMAQGQEDLTTFQVEIR